MKQLLLGVIALFLTMVCSCDDSTSDSDIPHHILGSWSRLMTDDTLQFNVAINFNESSKFTFKMLEEAPGHHDSFASYRLTDEEVTFYNDTDCHVEGTYKYSIDKYSLTLELVDDGCEGRGKALAAVWMRNDTLELD